MNRLSRHTFDDFIVGDGNRAARMAALEAARNPGRRYNPLFLYGGTGTGKTHLLAAIADEATRTDRSIAAHYVGYQTFADQVREARETGDRSRIEKALSKVDLFLLDDVGNDDMWPAVQQELIHWIDRFVQEERQVVLASDKSPLALDPYNEKFLSRIQRGLIVSIARVDRAVKMEVIERLMETENVEAADDALDCLADLPVGDIRELAGIVNRILVSLAAEKAALTLEWLTTTLQQLAGTGEIRKFRVASTGRSVRPAVREEFFETGEPEEPELSHEELLSIAEMDVRIKKESPDESDWSAGEEEAEAASVQSVHGEKGGAEEERQALVIDESEGFFLEWDREIDRLLDEL